MAIRRKAGTVTFGGPINMGLNQPTRPGSGQTTQPTVINQGLVQRPTGSGPSTVTLPGTATGVTPRPGSTFTTNPSTNQPLVHRPPVPTAPLPIETPVAPTSENECLKKGGRWVDGACQMYDVVAEYQYQNPQPTQPQQPSETTLHAGQVQVGHDLIAGMVNAGVFDASGYGAAMNKWKQAEISERDRREALKLAQHEAAQGRSFSANHMDELKLQAKDVSLQRIAAKTESEAAQAKREQELLQRKQKLIELANLGVLAPGAGVGSYTPGAFSPGLAAQGNFGLGTVPIQTDMPTNWPGKEGGAAAVAENRPDPDAAYTDSAGFQCTVGDKDNNNLCPANPNYTHKPEGRVA